MFVEKVTEALLSRHCHAACALRLKEVTMGKWKSAHPAIGLFVFSAACAISLSEVSAQVATFTTQQYPLLGNTHIAADLNGDGRVDLAGTGANAVSVMLENGDGTNSEASFAAS
jgi:hypothetical protein